MYFFKKFIFLFFSDFEWKMIDIFVNNVLHVPRDTFAKEILMEVSYFYNIFQNLVKFLRPLTTSLQKVFRPEF